MNPAQQQIIDNLRDQGFMPLYLELPDLINELPQQDQKFLKEVLQEFVHDAVYKYFSGWREHQHEGHFFSRDCFVEGKKEIIDLLMYISVEEKRAKSILPKP